MTSTLSLDDINLLDRQIDQLNDYKPIPEHEVKALCDKVGIKQPIFEKVDFKILFNIWES